MTKPTSPDWVSMVDIAQATTAPAVVTAAETWSGEELLVHAARAAGWLSGAGVPRVPVPALLEASPRRSPWCWRAPPPGGRSRRSVRG